MLPECECDCFAGRPAVTMCEGFTEIWLAFDVDPSGVRREVEDHGAFRRGGKGWVRELSQFERRRDNVRGERAACCVWTSATWKEL